MAVNSSSSFLPAPQLILPTLPAISFVKVSHPSTNILIFSFPCYPTDPTNPSSLSAVSAAMVLEACYIMANNTHGYLSTDKNGQTMFCSRANAGIALPPNQYYLHMETSPGQDHDYLLCLSFKTWTPSEPPERWLAARLGSSDDDSGSESEILRQTWQESTSSWVRRQDKRCLISGTSWALNACHLVPAAEDGWFLHHSYWEAAHDETQGVHSPRNIITLFCALKTEGLDRSRFVIVPFGRQFCTVVLDETAEELAAAIHLRTIELPKRLRVHYIWARFAWNVIQRASSTITTERRRFLRLVRVPSNFPKPVNSTSISMEEVDRVPYPQSLEDTGNRLLSIPESQRSPGPLQTAIRNDLRLQATMKCTPEEFDNDPTNSERIPNDFDGRYPGWSHSVVLKADWVKEHPAASDSGGARVATWEDVLSERDYQSML
ncbi:hypothetical protein V5O48_003324 [Marasmius crinis-equi]|uniref:HNH nuclease domain-containing protein n=1 Tax=Marasmius crinis-equi TaxID=585013 RepID=A0ABR3FTA2_9AGAR